MKSINQVATRGYEQFFGLKEPPFSLAPDPRFLFAAASHSAALAEVAYAVDRREPIVVVSGDIGTGKTLLCRTVLRRLSRKTFVSVVDDPLLGPDELLRQLLEDFGVISRDRSEASSAARHDLVQALVGFLRSLGSIQAHAIVIIDEAQHLAPAVLEQIRLLSNIDDERGTLLQIILVGQTDVEPLLQRPELRQIQQRVSRRFRLEPLTRDEVEQYINHRLARAREGAPVSDVPGASELARALVDWEGDRPSARFEPSAIEVISELSGGVPRTINLLCDRALERACASGVRTIDATVVRAAASALGLGPAEEALIPEPFTRDGESASRRSPRRLAAAAVLIVAAVVASWIGYRVSTSRSTTPSPAPATTARPPVAAPPVGERPAPPPSGAAVTKQPATSTPPTQVIAPPSTTGAPAAAVQPSRATDAPANGPAGKFEIVVASFRTEPRAAAVQDAVAALGLPAQRRAQGGWQQVICGPFPSREAAQQAQQTLDRGGYGGTHLAPAR